MAWEHCSALTVASFNFSKPTRYGEVMAEWKAEWGNDPEREYGLVIEILEGDDWRGRIERTDTGELGVLTQKTVTD
jgi:hypothetical protein